MVQKAGVHSATVRRYLAQNFLEDGTQSGAATQFIDSAAASKAIADLSETVLLPVVSDMIGWNISDCRRLAELEILPAVVKRDVKGFGLKQRYSKSAVIAMKEGLVAKATMAPDQLQSLRALRVSVVSGQDDILKAVFDGRLQRMAYAECPSILDAIKVDLWEVMRHCPEVMVSPRTINKLLGFERTTFLALLELGAFSNATQGTAVSVKAGDVVEFDRAFVTSARVKRDYKLGRGDFLSMMKVGDIEPAFSVNDAGQLILRRVDIPRLLSAGGKDVPILVE